MLRRRNWGSVSWIDLAVLACAGLLLAVVLTGAASGSTPVQPRVVPRLEAVGLPAAAQQIPDSIQFATAARYAQTIIDAQAQAGEDAKWAGVHRCEQPDGLWTDSNSWLGGGLGISYGAWHENGGDQYAALPQFATAYQQEIVADSILARFGPSAWGCGSHLA